MDIKLIIVQFSHIPFDQRLLQQYVLHENINDYYSSRIRVFLQNELFAHSDTWQIEFHSKPAPSNKDPTINLQNSFNVYVEYTDGKSSQTLFFYSSVFYLPASLKSDKNFNAEVKIPSSFGFYEEVQ